MANYSIVTQLDKQNEEYGVALFLCSIRADVVNKYDNFDLSEQIATFSEKSSKHSITMRLEMLTKHMKATLNSDDQTEGETIDK